MPLPRFDEIRLPAHLLGHGLHHIQPDPAAGEMGDGVLHAEAGQEEKLQQLRGRQLSGECGGGEILPHHGGADHLQINAATVIRDLNHEHAGAVARLQTDGTQGGFPGLQPVRRQLNGVIHRIAQQMAQRGLHALQHLTVHRGGAAHDVQPHLLAQRAGGIPHQPGETLQTI